MKDTQRKSTLNLASQNEKIDREAKRLKRAILPLHEERKPTKRKKKQRKTTSLSFNSISTSLPTSLG